MIYSLNVSKNGLKNARTLIHRSLTDKDISVTLSHVKEALACSLGFNTHAALLTFVRSIPIGEKRYASFDIEKFVNRLFKLNPALDINRLIDVAEKVVFNQNFSVPYIVVGDGTVDYFEERNPQHFSTAMMSNCRNVLRQLKLNPMGALKNPDTKKTSYNYKHDIETAYRLYTSNGALILAALELDIPVKRNMYKNSTNTVYFYFSPTAFYAALHATSDARI